MSIERPFSWLKTIRQSGMSGLPALLATHCQCVSFDEGHRRLTLEVPPQLLVFVDAGGFSDVRSVLAPILGEGLTIEWIEGSALQSPAIRARDKKLSQIKNVHLALAGDPFAMEMTRAFGGKIVIDSCIPLSARAS